MNLNKSIFPEMEQKLVAMRKRKKNSAVSGRRKYFCGKATSVGGFSWSFKLDRKISSNRRPSETEDDFKSAFRYFRLFSHSFDATSEKVQLLMGTEFVVVLSISFFNEKLLKKTRKHLAEDICEICKHDKFFTRMLFYILHIMKMMEGHHRLWLWTLILPIE